MIKKTFLFIVVLVLGLISQGQLPGSYSYDFRDGTIISNQQSEDGKLTLSGNYNHHGTTYGLNMKVDGEIKIAASGSTTYRFLGSKHSKAKMIGTAVNEGDMGTQNTQVVNDLLDTYDFVYSGSGASLQFKTTTGTGGDIYLPAIEVIPAQSGTSASAAEKNIIYYFDLRDGSIIPTATDGKTAINSGLFNLEVGSKNAYGYNGDQHGAILKEGNKISLQVAGNSKIKVGGSSYSNGTIAISSATGNFDVASKASATSGNFGNDGSSVDFLYVGEAGSVTLDFTGTNYVPYLEIAPIPFEVSLSNYEQKSGKITINGIEISLSSGATSAELPNLSISEGIVMSSSKSAAKLALNLGGADLSALNPELSGNIASTSIADGKLIVNFANPDVDPKTFSIELYDNSYLHGKTSYDLTDGTIIGMSGTEDGALKLLGNFSHHGTQYGLNMKLDGEIKIAVNGSSSIQFLGSKYSSLNMIGTATLEGDLGTQNTQVANDLAESIDFVYAGAADTLSFKTIAGSGNDLYLPLIELIPAQTGAAYSLAQKNIIYNFDFRDGSIIPSTTDGKSDISKGLVEVKVGSSNAYGYNGTQHGSILKGGNQIKLQVAGNSKIKIGGSIYSNGTITASSESGNFDISSQASATSGNFGNDGSTVDFMYVGEAGTVTFDFEGTNYIPMIELVPVPYAVSLESWVKKSGTISINGTTITLTSGDDASSVASLVLSDGIVNSALADIASVRINLGGKTLNEYTPELAGDIESVSISGDTLKITYADASTLPNQYKIVVADNSTEVNAEAGKTYTYNFADGSVLPQVTTIKYPTFISSDGMVSMNSNDGDQFWYHDAAHGGVFYNKNSIEIHVAGNATITFITCTYSADNAVLVFTDSNNAELGSIAAENNGGTDAFASNFSYSGPAGIITATLVAEGAVYFHGLTIENGAEIIGSNGLIDVWDFGAMQLDSVTYNNNLNEEIINSWYAPSITVASSGNVLPSFSAGVLSWIGGGNDRLRTSNTALTRYDENIASVTDYNGRIYVNSGANTGRYLSLALSADDEVTLIAKTDAGGRLNFEYVPDPSAQTDQLVMPSDLTEVHFVAKQEGTYHVYDDQGKPSYFRIYRKDASYVNLSGSIDLANATDVPDGYSIVFTNEAGKTWTSNISGTNYSVKVPVGYSYNLSLSDANGYIISSDNAVEVAESTTTFAVALAKVQLFTASGSITGLGDETSKLKLMFSTDPTANKLFVPTPIIDQDAATYSVQLEANTTYTISATGVNNFFLPVNTITMAEVNQTTNIAFASKPLYKITISATGLDSEQLAKLGLTFTNLNEEGYTYSFSSLNDISLRDGTYSMSYSGLNEYPMELAATSNLTVSGAAISKTLAFSAVKNWSFDDQVIADGSLNYKGLLFSGSVKNEIAKGHLVTKPDATIKVPVNPGEKLVVTYYYAADFIIEGGEAITTASGSTSTMENATYIYTGSEAGYVTITIGSGAGTTYITNLFIDKVVAFTSTITVGTDKNYTSINDALDAIAKMDRPNNERVTVMIDPGNYEEMLVINSENVSFKNAAAMPSIALKNKGVDIEAGAVRITSYYGHGYNYYSMGTNQKWDADLLRVNKENGYLSYANKGAGTTNGSYWNTTVMISASGFEAEHIIFENSFNQYISKKESEDVVVMWESGGKGIRPTDIGNTAVQNKSFVERAAAIAIGNNIDKVVLNQCLVVGHQDSFFGGTNSRVAVYKGAVMGGTDYLFGGMIAVFYKTDLVMLTSDDSNDVSYLTAAQQGSGRGYLMYECTVRSAVPGVENASASASKPGYFGRPWQATTSEVVFYNTTIEASSYPGSEGQSLIQPIGWMNSLGGESKMMYEYGTIEASGENNQSSRASWSTLLTEPTLSDGTAITAFNFTKGSDGWDPIATLDVNDIVVANFVVENILVGTVDSPEDFTCNLQMNWDTENINLVFDIADDSIVSTGTNYQVDNLEVYFDMDNSKNIKWPRNGGWMSADPTYDTNDYQLRLVPGVDFSVNNTLTGATQVYQLTETGYRFELTIPWNSLMAGFVPSNGTKIGFDVLASDNDATASDANRNQISLIAPTPNPYNDPSLFGTFQFDEGGSYSIIPDVEAPGIVSGLTASAVKKDVTLAWENASDNIAVLYYNIYQGSDLVADKVYAKETGNTFVIKNLEDGDYTYSMETVDNFGNVSASKASVSVTVLTTSAKFVSNGISVYPNPVLNQLTIRGVENIIKIEVLGITGNVVKTFESVNSINVSELSKGTYILKVQSDQNVLTTKFIKN
ncbi:MAG: pectinesterase family protein [Prolixibacteraceae bacterium]